MKSYFTLASSADEQQVCVELLSPAEDRYRVTVGEQALEVVAHPVGNRGYQVITADHVVRDMMVTGALPELVVLDATGEHRLQLLDEQLLARRQQRGAGELLDGAGIVAPMPGKVVKALVVEGDEVDEGQGVIVVEAMKMENELRAPASGTIKEIKVASGDSVEAGQMLVVIG